jgi:hypothetical protein
MSDWWYETLWIFSYVALGYSTVFPHGAGAWGAAARNYRGRAVALGGSLRSDNSLFRTRHTGVTCGLALRTSGEADGNICMRWLAILHDYCPFLRQKRRASDKHSIIT